MGKVKWVAGRAMLWPQQPRSAFAVIIAIVCMFSDNFFLWHAPSAPFLWDRDLIENFVATALSFNHARVITLHASVYSCHKQSDQHSSSD